MTGTVALAVSARPASCRVHAKPHAWLRFQVSGGPGDWSAGPAGALASGSGCHVGPRLMKVCAFDQGYGRIRESAEP